MDLESRLQEGYAYLVSKSGATDVVFLRQPPLKYRDVHTCCCSAASVKKHALAKTFISISKPSILSITIPDTDYRRLFLKIDSK